MPKYRVEFQAKIIVEITASSDKFVKTYAKADVTECLDENMKIEFGEITEPVKL